MAKLNKVGFAKQVLGSDGGGLSKRRKRRLKKKARKSTGLRTYSSASSDYSQVSAFSSEPVTQTAYESFFGGGAFAHQVQMSSPFRTISKKTKGKKGGR